MSRLTKISTNFSPRAMASLEMASQLTGDSRTDVLNRAIQLYAYRAQVTGDGSLLVVENPVTGAREKLVVL